MFVPNSTAPAIAPMCNRKWRGALLTAITFPLWLDGQIVHRNVHSIVHSRARVGDRFYSELRRFYHALSADEYPAAFLLRRAVKAHGSGYSAQSQLCLEIGFPFSACRIAFRLEGTSPENNGGYRTISGRENMFVHVL